jgi:hypothetical protein
MVVCQRWEEVELEFVPNFQNRNRRKAQLPRSFSIPHPGFPAPSPSRLQQERQKGAMDLLGQGRPKIEFRRKKISQIAGLQPK